MSFKSNSIMRSCVASPLFQISILAVLVLSTVGCGGPSFREECVIRSYYRYVVFDEQNTKKILENDLTIDEVADELGLVAVDGVGLNSLTLDECMRTTLGTFSLNLSFLKKGYKAKLRDYYSEEQLFSGKMFDVTVKNFSQVNFYDTCSIERSHSESFRETLREFVPQESQQVDQVEGWWTTEDQRIYIYLGRSRDNSEYIGTLVYTSNTSEKRYSKIMSIRKSASDSLYLGSIWLGGKKHFTAFFLSSDMILTPRTRAKGELENLSLIKLQMPTSTEDAWLRIEPLLRESVIH